MLSPAGSWPQQGPQVRGWVRLRKWASGSPLAGALFAPLICVYRELLSGGGVWARGAAGAVLPSGPPEGTAGEGCSLPACRSHMARPLGGGRPSSRPRGFAAAARGLKKEAHTTPHVPACPYATHTLRGGILAIAST